MRKYCFGVDVGGTTVKLGFFDVKGNVIDKWEIPTKTENNGISIVPDIAEAIKDKLKEKQVNPNEVEGVGVGVPGPVNDEGVVSVAVNLGWENMPLAKDLSELIDMPVRVGNDANVAALGEMWCGGGKGYNNLVAITLGTGVGGGIILNGGILNGATGAGGEIGHLHIVDDEKVPCNCGCYGCLEQYASATGIVKLANECLAASKEDSILRTQEISAKAVFDAAKEKDKLACEVVDKFAEYLGKGLSVIAAVVNPQVFVIGGGVSKAGDIILDSVMPYFKKYTFQAAANADFKLATLGNDAGIFGAAKMILD